MAAQPLGVLGGEGRGGARERTETSRGTVRGGEGPERGLRLAGVP